VSPQATLSLYASGRTTGLSWPVIFSIQWTFCCFSHGF
jgi:hypothetical protein